VNQGVLSNEEGGSKVMGQRSRGHCLRTIAESRSQRASWGYLCKYLFGSHI